jgi:POLQ-like helicase
MRPEQKSQSLLGVTRSKAKMLEYGIPEEHHIKIPQDPAKLFTLSIGLLGDLAAGINREALQPDILADLRKNLLFSAHFFDAYLQSKLNETLDPYLVLLGSASYYLCDLPGSAMVLAKRIGSDCPDLGGEGLEDLLLQLLQGDLSTYFDGLKGPFGSYIDSISRWVIQFFQDGTGEDNLIDLAKQVRAAAYESGTPRQLLFGDVIAAILRKKIQNSSWNALPLYSGISRDKWLHALQKESFIKELWPAQHLLGEADVLKGESAVVQMPTSAGKTKATELIIRSAFLAERTSLAVIIAPFRALCHEIKNSLVSAFHNESTEIDELSDAMQTDFEIAELLGHQQILVVTPEKLLYVLRHAPELASGVGLLIFDEGHQFDSGTRGITYELLLTSLRSMLPEEAQKVLISAVISNAEAVGEWLNKDPKTVDGQNLLPTYRSIAFASFIDLRGIAVKTGWMKYVQPQTPENLEYFVPQVIEKMPLERKKGESLDKVKYFPNSNDGKEIAIFLGLRLVSQGAVAVFCGRKDTASGLCEMVSERFSRNLSMASPKEYSDSDEISKLSYLIEQNLGSNTPATQSAQIGVFPHHGNTPHGIRLAVEHAIREGLVRFVVCTSTLAQGVNLPIRYLIVTSVYQGRERIKVRDFHNLIGRAGRAGMHTEGSVLFADPIVYDKRRSRKENWRWEIVKELLDPSKSEECVSSLFKLIPLVIRNDRNKSKDRKEHSLTWDILSFASAYIEGWDSLNNIVAQIAKQYHANGFTGEAVKAQFEFFSRTISSIEGFLLSNWDIDGQEISEADVIRLAEETLAYFLADEPKREQIRGLFKLLAENIAKNINDPDRRKIFGRTLYGVRDAQSIEGWVQVNSAQLMATSNEGEILNVVWPLLTMHIHNGVFRKFDKPDVLKEIMQEWIEGKPFHDLLGTIQKRKAKLIWGTRRRDFKIDHVVEVCEGGFAYDGALLIGALSEFVGIVDQEGSGELMSGLYLFQKQLKYGLPSDTAIVLYEMGFSDRVIAQELATLIDGSDRKSVRRSLRNKKVDVLEVLGRYPIYYSSEIYEKLV